MFGQLGTDAGAWCALCVRNESAFAILLAGSTYFIQATSCKLTHGLCHWSGEEGPRARRRNLEAESKPSQKVSVTPA